MYPKIAGLKTKKHEYNAMNVCSRHVEMKRNFMKEEKK